MLECQNGKRTEFNFAYTNIDAEDENFALLYAENNMIIVIIN